MEISIAALIGGIIAIVILYAIVRALLTIAAQKGAGIDPSIVVLIWLVALIIACLIIAWALGVDIPFFRWK